MKSFQFQTRMHLPCTPLALREGISSGISAGAAIHAALTVMKRPEMAGKTAVTILPDTGDRYVSSGLFETSVGHTS
jgi:cysteine synthase